MLYKRTNKVKLIYTLLHLLHNIKKYMISTVLLQLCLLNNIHQSYMIKHVLAIYNVYFSADIYDSILISFSEESLVQLFSKYCVVCLSVNLKSGRLPTLSTNAPCFDVFICSFKVRLG